MQLDLTSEISVIAYGDYLADMALQGGPYSPEILRSRISTVIQEVLVQVKEGIEESSFITSDDEPERRCPTCGDHRIKTVIDTPWTKCDDPFHG